MNASRRKPKEKATAKATVEIKSTATAEKNRRSSQQKSIRRE